MGDWMMQMWFCRHKDERVSIREEAASAKPQRHKGARPGWESTMHLLGRNRPHSEEAEAGGLVKVTSEGLGLGGFVFSLLLRLRWTASLRTQRCY